MSAHQLGMEALARGEKARREGRAGEATQAFIEARAHFGQCDAPSDEAHAVASLAQLSRDAGDDAIARTLQEQAVALAHGSGDRARYAHSVRNLADMLSDAGEAEAAAPLYREALAIYLSGPYSPLDTADALRGAALNAEQRGVRDEARRLWQAARDRYAMLDLLMRSAPDQASPGVAEADRHLAALKND